MVTVKGCSPQQGMQRPSALERLGPEGGADDRECRAGVNEITAMRGTVRNKEKATGVNCRYHAPVA
jgi:hypothetical protein